MESVGSLEEEARKRKERLRNLKNRKTDDGEKTTTNNETEKLPKPVFRSYKPLDERLKDSSLPNVKPADVSEKIQDHLEATQSKSEVEELDLTNLAPRKPDWDLKRDVAKKLEKLERRTQRAIAELIRERLKKSGEDLAQVVSAGGVGQDMDDDDND